MVSGAESDIRYGPQPLSRSPIMEDDGDDAPETTIVESGAKVVDPLQVLEVFPAELRIICQLNAEVSYAFNLKNISDKVAAFKVKTTAPRRYMVRPAQGIISPADTAVITVVLVKISQYPDQSNPRNLRDKFLVQSLALSQEISPEELNTLWATKEKQHDIRSNRPAYYEHRLKCRLIIPPIDPHSVQSAAKSSRSTSLIDASSVYSEDSSTALGIVVTPPQQKPVINVNLQEVASPQPSILTPNVELSESAPMSPVQVPLENIPTPALSPIQLSGVKISDAADSTSNPSIVCSPCSAIFPATTSVEACSESQGDAVPIPNQQTESAADAPNESESAPMASSETAAETGSSHSKEDRTSMSFRQDFESMVNRPREYEKMLAYSVKLTVEREALEGKLAKLTEQNAFLVQENEQLRKKIALDRASNPPLEGSTEPEDKQRSVLEALQESGVSYKSFADSDPTFSENQMSLAASQMMVNTGIQLWQVVTVAALCFLIGRIL